MGGQAPLKGNRGRRVQSGIKFGASTSQELFNSKSNLGGRKPNVVKPSFRYSVFCGTVGYADVEILSSNIWQSSEERRFLETRRRPALCLPDHEGNTAWSSSHGEAFARSTTEG